VSHDFQGLQKGFSMFAPLPAYFDSPSFANMHNPFFDAVIYLEQPETIHGFLFPFVLSLLSVCAYRKAWDRETTMALIASITLAWNTVYMGHTGLHTFPVEVFFLAVLAWRREDKPFPLMLGYAFAFCTALSSDVLHGLQHPANGLWQTWYYGIGGAGFHDGLFIAPIFGCFAVLLARFGKWLSVELNRLNRNQSPLNAGGPRA